MIRMTKEEILRTATLLRNPERGHCPNCKKPLREEKNGDLYCPDFSLNADAKCVWHRYKNGLNYWSSTRDVIETLSKEHDIPLPKGFR